MMNQRVRVISSAVLAIVASVAILAQPAPTIAWRPIAAGVEHAQFVREGPLNINAIRIDTSRARLDVVKAMDEGVGLETVSSMAQRHAAIAAINGGYFRTTGTYRGDSIGTLVIDRKLLSEPDRARSSMGLVRAGETTKLIVGNVTWQAEIEVAGKKRKIDGLNRPRMDNELVVFTSGFHRTTLTDAAGIEVVVRGERVSSVRDSAGSSVIPSDGYVISAIGEARRWARETLRAGVRVRLSHRLVPADPSPRNPWPDAEDILGGGPTLVTAGRVNVTDKRESMLATFATDLHPRTAIASLTDGRVLLLVVDGRQLGLSIGIALEPLARLLIEMGAETAMNLDGGGSTTMVVQGKIVNSPSDPTGERPVSDAIVIRPQPR